MLKWRISDACEQFSGVGEAVFGSFDQRFVDDGGVLGQPRHAFADGDWCFVEDEADGSRLESKRQGICR